MYPFLLTLHILVCALVILVVLVQSGKGAGLQLFGGGGGDALFSAPSGSMFVRKLTTGLAVAFFLTCMMLTYIGARRNRFTVTQGAWPPAGAQMPGQEGAMPAAPETPAPQPAPAQTAPSETKK